MRRMLNADCGCEGHSMSSDSATHRGPIEQNGMARKPCNEENDTSSDADTR